VTPPLGHPLCGGWIEAVRGVDDPLRALGVVLLGPAAPVVLCAVDWCGLRNEANALWRDALAKAAHTTPARVAVHCVHPHTPPSPAGAPKSLRAAAAPPRSPALDFFRKAVSAGADAGREALKATTPLTHVGDGKATVEKVASNRRILGPDDKVKAVRYSA